MLQEVIDRPTWSYKRVTNDDLIHDRTKEIKEIEADMIEVFQITNDLGEIVESQDDDIIHIEDTITSAHKNVKDGAKEIKKANKKKNSKRWCKITLASMVVILLTVGLIIIL